MGVQVALHHADQGRIENMDVDEHLHTLHPIVRRPAVRDLNIAPAVGRLEAHEQIAATFTPIFIVDAGWLV